MHTDETSLQYTKNTTKGFLLSFTCSASLGLKLCVAYKIHQALHDETVQEVNFLKATLKITSTDLNNCSQQKRISQALLLGAIQ